MPARNHQEDRPRDNADGRRIRQGLQLLTGLAALIVILSIVWNPSIIYAATPRVVLFLFLSMFPAILFGDWISSRFQFTAKQSIASGSGVFASMIIVLLLLTHFSEPDQKIVEYIVRDCSTGQPVSLAFADAPPTLASDKLARIYKLNSSIVVRFPDDIGTVSLLLTAGDKEYRGSINFIENSSLTTLCLTDDGKIRAQDDKESAELQK
jgi:hypothetical protein